MSALSIPMLFQPALLPPSYEIFPYHPLIKFLTSIYYFWAKFLLKITNYNLEKFLPTAIWRKL